MRPVIGGYTGLMDYGLFELLTSGPKELPAKLGLAAMVPSFMIQLVQMICERAKTYKTDHYMKIERWCLPRR